MDQEQALVGRIKEGEPGAFRELVELYKQNVYYLALDLSGNHHDAEDLSQEVFIKAHRSIDKFRGGAKLSTWLYRITMNTYIDSKRRKSLNVISLHDRGDDDSFDPMDVVADESADDPERKLRSAKIDDHINDALQALSEQERTVFVMRHYQDMPIKEIANSLRIAEGTVKSLLFRSVRKLRDKLAFYRDDLGLEDSL